MTDSLEVVAAPDAAGLACGRPRGQGGAGVLTIGDAGRPAGSSGPWVRWSAGPPPDSGDALDIAPAGEGLWRRAPWPAADELFELAPPSPSAPVLVAGGEEARRGELTYALDARGVPVRPAERLTREALEQASAVLLLPAPGAEGAIPAQAMAVLAARRPLVTPVAQTTFGLLPGIDHLQFTLFSDATDLIVSARSYPAAFGPMLVWGALAAGRHRASEVIARLEADLALLGQLPGLEGRAAL